VAAKKKTSKKKVTRKKTAKKKVAARKQAAAVVASIEKDLKNISKQIEKSLAPLRKEIDKAERKAGSGGARLLRQARAKLNAVDLKGHSELDAFLRKSRRELSKTLSDLERSVRPKATARKKPARKKA
jgi:hypothetical protein